MGNNAELQLWLINSMLLLGGLIFLVGIWIIVLPQSFLDASKSMAKWVSTDGFFDSLDKPRYQERLIYKYHRIAGALIILGASYTMIILITGINIRMLVVQFPVIINRFLSEWFYGSAYMIMLVANALAVLVGIIVLVRPSLLKKIEGSLNKWISMGQGLKSLDDTHEIALEVLPGNPRLFGLAVALGGVYIVISMLVLLV